MSTPIEDFGRNPLYPLRVTLTGVLKVPFVIRQNLSALLAARKETPSALARHVGKHKTWISQFLTGKRDELQLRDLDKIAAFFGIATYQLLQPGISRLTERRTSEERRSGQDRRVGHNRRLLSYLQEELNKVPRLASQKETPRGARAVPSAVQTILSETERRIAAYYRTHADEADDNGGVGSTVAARRRRRTPRPDVSSPPKAG